MKTTFFLATTLLLLSVSFSSCKKPQTYCGVKDPTEISWVKNLINANGNQITIYETTYNGMEGIYWEVQLSATGNASSGSYNTCDNVNAYSFTNGIVYTSNFPDDFYRNATLMKKIYPK